MFNKRENSAIKKMVNTMEFEDLYRYRTMMMQARYQGSKTADRDIELIDEAIKRKSNGTN